MASELRKTARSVVYNLAEGHRRSSRREFAHFLDISLGSCSELETQLLLAEALSYFNERAGTSLLSDLEEVKKMLFRLRQRVASSAA